MDLLISSILDDYDNNNNNYNTIIIIIIINYVCAYGFSFYISPDIVRRSRKLR